MVGSLARRFSVLIAGVALVAIAATLATAPVAVAAAGLIAGPQPVVQATPGSAFNPDVQVTPNGVQVDANGNTYYTFTIKNVGLGLAKNVKVTRLSQVKEIVYPQKLKNTITVLQYDTIAAGQSKPLTILCEYSQLYSCRYASVEVDVENADSNEANNYASQTS
jgi:hypothetical protein